MTHHITTGRTGEDLAAEWLSAKGFAILCRNWRHGRHEIDIIASKHSVLHFIEVKSRNSILFGRPEESVSKKKLHHILQGASGWLIDYPGHGRIQYDVLSITLTNSTPEYFLIEDVYL
ncbi:MAG: YraN family protein [Bacteroidetes bacterium]|nr:YraN family protein [Bacteroidota bacterium]